jgi:hypothetical protein
MAKPPGFFFVGEGGPEYPAFPECLENPDFPDNLDNLKNPKNPRKPGVSAGIKNNRRTDVRRRFSQFVR